MHPPTLPSFISLSSILLFRDDLLYLAEAHAVVVVCGPAGSGKTTVVSDWGGHGTKKKGLVEISVPPSTFFSHALSTPLFLPC